jgi:LCP family protein required for cell wall assembly
MSKRTETHALRRLDELGRSTRVAPAAGRPGDRPGDRPNGSVIGEMAISIVVPGATALRRSIVIGSLLLIAGVVLPIVIAVRTYTQRGDLIGLALDPTFLLYVAGLGLVAVIARLVAIAEIANAFRTSKGIGARTAVATLVVLALGSPILSAAYQANQARAVVSNVFASGDGDSLFVPAVSNPNVDADSVKTILLLGGDAGPGRWGLRTDTMILVTIHEATGRTALISIPRNLTRIQFPPGSPLAAVFPNGFDDLTNAVFPYVSTHPDLMEHYGANGLQAEAVALSEALGYSLDVEIDDYALVNMQGFTEVIDAIGGVTLELDGRVPLPPSLPGERPLPAEIGPGLIDMDGAMAIAYVRSRSADSDYQRMGRQRQLLAALGSQVTASEAIGGFGKVTGVLDDSMRTSLSSNEFSDLLDRLGDNNAIQESVGLVPPLVQPGSPDYAVIRQIVAAVQSAVVNGTPSGYAG